jgi:hypothetical protein
MPSFPRITFGIIVLNGEPFTRYCIRQIYPFAHQIVVVEGACERARAVATPDGHSTDATLDVLREFQRTEDPDHKLEVVTREGFWSEKDEQSQAFAERATGDYLWQVDIDEFYTADALRAVIAMLRADPAITAVSFPMRTFWGAPDVLCDSLYLRSHDPALQWNPSEIHRIFRWAPGYRYATHRPPTVLDTQGRDVRRQGRWIGAPAMRQRGVWMLHYSLLFPKQVREKCAYYSAMDWAASKCASEWAETCYLRIGRPFHVHNVYQHISWLCSYADAWPEQIEAMWRDIAGNRVAIDLRPMADARALMARPAYRLARVLLEAYAATLLNPLLRAWGWVHRIGPLRHLRRWFSR